MFSTPELRMQYSRRIFTPSSSLSSTCPNSNRGCKLSSFPHHPGRTHHTTTIQIHNIPTLSPYTFFSPSISLSSPYSKRRLSFSSRYSSTAARSYPTKAGSSTRAMPDRQKSKNKSATTKEVDISKGLSYLLRHGAKNEGVRLDEGGWANVADVVGLDISYFSYFFGAVGYVERSLSCLPVCLYCVG